MPNNLTAWQLPCRVDGHSARDWFDVEHQIRRSIDRHYAGYGLAQKRFRAWAALGNGDILFGDWITRADLPVWEPGVSEAELLIRFRETT